MVCYASFYFHVFINQHIDHILPLTVIGLAFKNCVCVCVCVCSKLFYAQGFRVFVIVVQKTVFLGGDGGVNSISKKCIAPIFRVTECK